MTKSSCWVSAITDPWIEHAVEDVRRKVEEDYERGGDEQIGQHDVGVEVVDAIEVPLSQTLPAEDDLGDDGAAEHCGEVQGDDGRHRDERVPQHVADQHPALTEPLGASKADVVGVERLDHGRTLING